jgi:hypothetical protein
MWKPIHRLVAVAVLVAASTLGVTGPAHAGVLDVTCTGNTSTTYNPPLDNTPTDTQLTVTSFFGPCVSTSVPGLTSGSYSVQFTIPSRSCVTLLNTGAEEYTITWNTGQTSTLSINRNATLAGPAFVVTHIGIVSSGLFAGDTVLRTATAPSIDLQLCLLGLGTVSGIFAADVLELTSL